MHISVSTEPATGSSFRTHGDTQKPVSDFLSSDTGFPLSHNNSLYYIFSFLILILCILSHKLLMLQIFFNMLSSLVYDRTHMIVCQWIEHGFSLSSALDQFVLLQNPKLMWYCRLCHIQCFRKVAYTYLCFEKHKQNTDSCSISENLKQICQILKLRLFWHSFIYNFHWNFMIFRIVTSIVFMIFQAFTIFLHISNWLLLFKIL